MPFINLEKAATLGDALLDLSVRLTENSTELRNWGYLEESALGTMGRTFGTFDSTYLPVLEALSQRISDLGAAMEVDGEALLRCVSLYNDATGGVTGG